MSSACVTCHFSQTIAPTPFSKRSVRIVRPTLFKWIQSDLLTIILKLKETQVQIATPDGTQNVGNLSSTIASSHWSSLIFIDFNAVFLFILAFPGIYSLEWETLGQRLYQVSFEQNAVSVSLSPTCRYLVVGLSARRRISLGTETDTIAQILQLDGGVPSKHNSFPQRGKLTKVRGLELYRELSSMSLNCIRWAPTPGQGIVCGTNTGQLTFLR